MNTCATCTHWRKSQYRGLLSTVVANTVGECRGGPPVADFKWPKTISDDTCASWQAIAGKPGRVATETRAPAQAEIFDAGERAPAPAAGVLAYDAAAAPSTAQGARPASIRKRK